MKNIKTTGIVIAENSLGDSDKILTILTPNVGKISCVAKGAKRPKSMLLAGSQLLCFGEYDEDFELAHDNIVRFENVC